MRQDGAGGEQQAGQENSGLLENLVETLMREAEVPPREVNGVGDEFLAGKLSAIIERGKRYT